MEVHLIDHPSYANWVISPTHPTQGRRYVAATAVLEQLAAEGQLNLIKHVSVAANTEQLHKVHAPHYVRRVLEDGICGEWTDSRPDLAEIASYFFGGTMLAQKLLAEGANLVVHLPGAKHHAMADRSSGFCVFADFAALAHALAAEGKRVACLDVDVHHGDGTEELTRHNESILTFSVHQQGIFPGTGAESEDDFTHHVHNRPLPAGASDAELEDAVAQFADLASDFGADVLLLAVGGDGHAMDPLASLLYTEAGLAKALVHLRQVFPNIPVVMGGAGGYRPDDYTPSMWVHAVAALAGKGVEEVLELRLLERVIATVRLDSNNEVTQNNELEQRSAIEREAAHG